MKIIFLYIYVILNFSLLAQEKINIKFHFQDNETFPTNIKVKTSYKNFEKAIQKLETLKREFYSKGYIEFSIDSLIRKETQLNTYLHIGKQYKLAYLANGNINKEVLDKIKYSEKDFKETKFNFENIEKLINKISSYYLNRGYPFVDVFMDSVYIYKNIVYSKIYAEPHKLFLIDTIIIHGNSKTTSKYLQNYLAIKKGDLYNQSKIEEASIKIQQLPFITEVKDIQLVFIKEKVELNIFLEKQKSNEINLLLGILPNDKLTNRKITITGEGLLHLYNSFGVGEEIFFNFKQIRPKTQNIDIEIKYPFLLNLPVGINTSFKLFKNDTSYININSKLGLMYNFNGVDKIQLFYQNKISNVLNFDTQKVANNELPEILDKTTNIIGLQLFLQKLDYIINPRKGYIFSITGKVGARNIRINSELQKINNNIYNNISQKTINYNIELEFKYYFPILKRHSILLANNSKFFISQNVLNNEKYRIGGAKTLRGFDEEEVLSPYFSLLTLEYHFSLTKNSYFYTFGDIAIVEDIRFGSKSIDTPFGFGLGATFETKGGIFKLSYALGKQLNNKIEFKNGKIHFGYINLF